ncbi:Auxin-responsive protein SAUR78 [Linum perenne]
MAKVGKLTKLKSAIKRWPSFTTSKLTHSSSSTDHHAQNQQDVHQQQEENDDLHQVYVGKSRRRYLLTSEVTCHPLFQELMQRSGGFDADGHIVVGSEVVLFEHLLWMINQNCGGGEGSQFGPMEDLVGFYCC